MKKTVVIHQPDFLPYLGFFHRFLYADLYIALNDVQFVNGTSNAWTNRDKIKTPQGEKWITVSVDKLPRDTKINDITISYCVDWQKQNLDLIKQNYRKTKFFDEIFPFIQELYSYKFEKLQDLNMQSIYMLNKLFDINIDIIFSSELVTTSAKSERLVELLKQVEATHYLSGTGAMGYHADEPFDNANIKVVWQEFNHPVYDQIGNDFIPNLSSIDMLFNCGIDQSRKILRSI